MTAIKTTNIVEGNLATEPKYFPKGQYVARIVFRIMHTDRKLNPQTNQWEDGRTTAVDVNFYGLAADVYGQINVYGVTTKSERHKRSYWTRTADGNGIGGRKAPVPYGS